MEYFDAHRETLVLETDDTVDESLLIHDINEGLLVLGGVDDQLLAQPSVEQDPVQVQVDET